VTDLGVKRVRDAAVRYAKQPVTERERGGENQRPQLQNAGTPFDGHATHKTRPWATLSTNLAATDRQ